MNETPPPEPPISKKEGGAPSLPTAETTEADLSRLTSISRDDLRRLREKMERGKDWTGGNGTPVVITAAGLERLRCLLAEKAAGEAAEALTSASEAVKQGTAFDELVVLKVKTPRVVLARKKDARPEDPPVRVMVKNSRNFVPGMELPRCQASARFPGLYFYHGGLPRRRGINMQRLRERQERVRSAIENAPPPAPLRLGDVRDLEEGAA